MFLGGKDFIGVCDINFSSARPLPVLNIVKLLCIAPSCLADPLISPFARKTRPSTKNPLDVASSAFFVWRCDQRLFPFSFLFLCFSAHRQFLTPRDTFSYLLIPLVRLSVNSIFFKINFPTLWDLTSYFLKVWASNSMFSEFTFLIRPAPLAVL